LPGIDIRAVPALDTIRSASRDRQVDAVVGTILNGMVSPDTRAVLLSGEHPMLANGATGVQDMSPADTSATMESGRREAGDGKRGALQGRGLGNIPQLNGLPQIVGLALGSPEFQRH
jgi:hypothetical protein